MSDGVELTTEQAAALRMVLRTLHIERIGGFAVIDPFGHFWQARPDMITRPLGPRSGSQTPALVTDDERFVAALRVLESCPLGQEEETPTFAPTPVDPNL